MNQSKLKLKLNDQNMDYFKWWITNLPDSEFLEISSQKFAESERESSKQEPVEENKSGKSNTKLGRNIKKETFKKSNLEIQEMIDCQIGYEPENIEQWRRLTCALDEVGLGAGGSQAPKRSEVININISTVENANSELGPAKLLRRRQKGEKITNDQKQFIHELIINKGVDEKT